MGNINYQNFVCDNYYCQQVSFKPEWLSESSWTINFEYIKNKLMEKPYNIDKGILKISNTESFHMLLSKKLFVELNEIKYLSIPINFSYILGKGSNIDIFIIFSNKLLILSEIKELDVKNDLFFITLNLSKNKITVYRSFNTEIVTKKIKSKKVNSFNINIENNFKILLITEKLFNNNIKNIYEEKHINTSNFSNYNELYLSLYIKCKNDLNNKEFIQLNFE